MGGVTSQADYTAIVDALGRVIAGVPEQLTKDVFYAFADISPKTLPEYIFKTVDGGAAYKAAGAFFSSTRISSKLRDEDSASGVHACRDHLLAESRASECL